MACAATLAVLGLSAEAGAAQPGVVLPSPGGAETQAQIAASGARNVRVFASWRALEPQPGRLMPMILFDYDALANRLRAAGISLSLVVTETPAWASDLQAPNAPPPPAAYADFLRRLASHFRGRVGAYEIWNEPNEATFWRGRATPAEYAILFKAAHAAIKSADPAARVGVGGLVGNDFEFLAGLYGAGARGDFDFVAVHTDTACNVTDPRAAGRDEAGRISRWSFTGYREVRAVMLDHGEDKPIWMTELGWSVTHERCPHGRGARAGMGRARQAAYLKRAYRCLAADPYVERASWFSLADFGTADRIGFRYGLYDSRGRARPALRAFRRAERAAPDRGCGLAVDRSGARIRIARPVDGRKTSRVLRYKASARDSSGLLTLRLLVDGREVRVTARRSLKGRWRGWRSLPYGPHTVTFRATDRAHNVTSSSVTVVRVPYGDGERIPTRIAAGVYGTGSMRTIAGTLFTRPAEARSHVRERIRIVLQRRVASAWRPVARARAGAVTRALTITRRFDPGRYRAVIRFPGDRSFAPAVARRGFRVSS